VFLQLGEALMPNRMCLVGHHKAFLAMWHMRFVRDDQGIDGNVGLIGCSRRVRSSLHVLGLGLAVFDLTHGLSFVGRVPQTPMQVSGS
jgi:hypothetical protein